MKKLQRYRINNCGQIADDKGGYCDADDVELLEVENAKLLIELAESKACIKRWSESHIHIDHQEFKHLAIMAMTHDVAEDWDFDMGVVHSVLQQIATGCMYYDNWMQAYHEIK